MKVLWKLTVASAIIAMMGMSTAEAQTVNHTGATYRYFDDGSVPAPVAESTGAINYSVGCDTGCATGCTGSCDSGCSSCDSCGSGRGLGLGSIFGKCCQVGDPQRLIGFECSGIEVGGWTQLGYHSENNNLFNSRPDELNLHQQYFFAEKAADGSDCCWDWGFRADIMYGIDAQDTQAFGNPPAAAGGWDNSWDNGSYGWALPQAYVEVANGPLSIIAGHFYTLVGYETVTAPDNFFYSHAYTQYNSEPFTHTGVLGTYALNDCTEIYGGWTLGWDTGFDRFQGGNNFLGGIKRKVNSDITATYITTMGDMGRRGEGYAHSFVLDMQVTDKVNWVVQNDWVSFNANNPTGNLNDTVGLNQYLLYQWSDCVGLGTRFEWWKADGGSLWEVTYGANIKPHSNVIIRPEARYDWGNTATANNFGFLTNQWTFGVDAILVY